MWTAQLVRLGWHNILKMYDGQETDMQTASETNSTLALAKRTVELHLDMRTNTEGESLDRDQDGLTCSVCANQKW